MSGCSWIQISLHYHSEPLYGREIVITTSMLVVHDVINTTSIADASELLGNLGDMFPWN